MAGTDTKTGERSGESDFAKVAKRLRVLSNNYSYGARDNENPERFLQSYDPFENIDRFRSRNAADNQATLALANQARNDELSRQLQLQSAKNDSAARQSNSNIYEAQQKANIDNNAYKAKLGIEQSAKPFSVTNTVDNSGALNYQRQRDTLQLQNNLSRSNSEADAYNQRLLTQMQGSQTLQQQYAQNQAQERLARISQQTSILSAGNAGESTWRWF